MPVIDRDATVSMKRAPHSLLLALLVATAGLANSTEAVAAAFTDLQKARPEDRKHIRYLSLHALLNQDEKTTADDVKVLAVMLNKLSRRARLRPLPAPNPLDLTNLLYNARKQPLLIRVDIRDFKWNPKVYERLERVEPFFHSRELVVEERLVDKEEVKEWPGGVWRVEDGGDGKEYPKGMRYKQVTKVKVPVPTSKRATGNAPWLPPKEISWLVEQTQSAVPIIRADWFFVQTAVSRARVAGYYDFLEIANRQEFFDLIGLDLAKAQKVEREVASIFQDSGVSILNRQVYRFGSLDGGYYQTRDVFDDQTRARNAIDSLNGKFLHDAEEHYGFLPNRLFAYFLSDNKGNLQTAAPPEVGGDKTTTSNDHRIHAPLSCIRCHVEGLRPLDDYGRQLWEGPGKLAAFDPKRFQRLDQLYLNPLKQEVEDDNVKYARALAQLNGPGWTPLKNAQAFKSAWERWNDRKVALEQAAFEMGGLDPKSLQERLRRYARPKNINEKGMPAQNPEEGGLGQLVPNSLLGYMLDPPRPMLREHFNEHFGTLHKAYLGLISPLLPEEGKGVNHDKD